MDTGELVSGDEGSPLNDHRKHKSRDFGSNVVLIVHQRSTKIRATSISSYTWSRLDNEFSSISGLAEVAMRRDDLDGSGVE